MIIIVSARIFCYAKYHKSGNYLVMFQNLFSEGGLSLDRLKSFCEVAEAGGVTKAAKGEESRQSLFSRQIKELEEFFGTELVWRKGRGIALTPAGEQLHILAREQLLALTDFKKICAGQKVELTVAAGDSLLQWVLLPRLHDIRQKLPNVAVKMLSLPTSEIARRLKEGTVDLCLVRDGSVAEPSQFVMLGAMTYSLFVPARMFPKVKVMDVSSKTLSELPLATLEGTGMFRQELDRLSKRHKLSLNIQIELFSFPLVAQAVRTGEFAAILPSIAAAELSEAEVVELKPEFLRALKSRRIVLAWSPRTARIRVAVAKAIPVFRSLCQLQ
jgi:DNA-binding transcriptional LysR family regulator